MITPKHLKDVKETYWQHLCWAWSSALLFAVLVPVALVHGLVPWLFAGLPDRMLINYLARFEQRRQRTGQAQKYPKKVL